MTQNQPKTYQITSKWHSNIILICFGPFVRHLSLILKISRIFPHKTHFSSLKNSLKIAPQKLIVLGFVDILVVLGQSGSLCYMFSWLGEQNSRRWAPSDHYYHVNEPQNHRFRGDKKWPILDRKFGRRIRHRIYPNIGHSNRGKLTLTGCSVHYGLRAAKSHPEIDHL